MIELIKILLFLGGLGREKGGRVVVIYTVLTRQQVCTFRAAPSSVKATFGLVVAGCAAAVVSLLLLSRGDFFAGSRGEK